MFVNMKKPNVIVFITDDQGYGDLGCTGNPWLKTPNIDAFKQESVSCDDFHVSPLCTPTRGALMTGRRPVRNGAWGVSRARALMRESETTMADIFAANGYRTGLFGKWHLGDNYPYRPTERGFDTAVHHRGGGVGQTPDYWNNNYFDDTYFHNNEPVHHDGYCTDIWFDETMRFIESSGDQPFLAYLATNAPHDPYLVEERYTKPYLDNPDIPHPAFYGMIANLDENFQRLRDFLTERGQDDNTIIIFMTDNGSSGGCRLDDEGFLTQGYNAGLRGKKGSFYEGGHRAPLYMRWPGGNLTGPRNVPGLTAHVDILPTLMELCELDYTDKPLDFDGMSIAPALRGKLQPELSTRVHIAHMDMRSGASLDKWRNAVMQGPWRLVHGTELYNVHDDPGQENDIATKHPEIVQQLREAHERDWEKVEAGISPYERPILGSDAENPCRLDAFDVMGDIAFVQSLVAAGRHVSGDWKVRFAQPGRYRFALRRWPEELDLPIENDISPEVMDSLIIKWPGNISKVLKPTEASLQISGQEYRAKVDSSEKEVVFTCDIAQSGEAELKALFHDDDGKTFGAYYVYVERLS